MSVTADVRTVSDVPAPAEVAARAVSRYRGHHDGYRLTGGYIAAPFVVTAALARDADLTRGLNGILGFDLAELHGGIGPVNAWTVSSFCSPDEGLIAGVDLLTSSRPDDSFYLFSVPGHDGEPIPAHAMYPTLDATAALLGRWQIRDAAFVPFAMKTAKAEGPAVLTAALAIGIPADTSQARLFMEDPDAETPAAYYDRLASPASEPLPGPAAGRRPLPPADPNALPDRISPWYKHARLKAAARSVTRIGAQRGRVFEKILVGADFTVVPEGYVGCAMAAVAYLQIAQDAVPAGGPARLVDMSLDQWRAECNA